MEINDFREKVVTVLQKNYERSGSIEPMFVYVDVDLQFGAESLKNFADNSKEYIALFLKELSKKRNTLFTAYITNSEVKELSKKDMEGFLELGDAYVPDEDSSSRVTKTVVVEINSPSERITINFKHTGTSDAPKLQIINEVKTNNKNSIANLVY